MRAASAFPMPGSFSSSPGDAVLMLMLDALTPACRKACGAFWLLAAGVRRDNLTQDEATRAQKSNGRMNNGFARKRQITNAALCKKVIATYATDVCKMLEV